MLLVSFIMYNCIVDACQVESKQNKKKVTPNNK